jgi:transcription elongation factor Elf1
LSLIRCFRSDLSAAVDVYSDWIDACDAVAKDTVGKDEDNDVPGMNARGSPRLVDAAGSDELTEANVADADLY